MTYEEFAKIQYMLPPFVPSDSIFNQSSWEDVQNFFAENPNGCIYRNPDETCYNFFSDSSDITEYNMYTGGDELFLLGLGKAALKGIIKLGKSGVALAAKGFANFAKSTISKKVSHHILSRHTLNGLKNQVGKAPIEKLTKKTIFNPKWSNKKVMKASEIAVKRALKAGVTDGKYTTEVFGETVTACMKNGKPDTVYGAIKVTEELLTK